MLFNSLAFLVFLPTVLVAYFFLPRKFRNLGLLIASYAFYACWDARFLSLLIISTVVDYWCSKRIRDSSNQAYRRRLLWLSLGVNLGLLAVFKYFNFFADNFIALLTLCGLDADPGLIRVILPVGISFYTFQTLSYTIDVYRGDLEPADNILDFAVYVSYFPQLVAGPIERASNLLPQLYKDREFDRDQFIDGIGLIATGFFKKVVVADRCAALVNAGFASDVLPYPGCQNWLFLYAFAFQIYCDFSGYSDIARGVSKMFGIELMLNFGKPYLVSNPSRFWRHWHISLSTWLRDYLYIPLGGNRGGVSAVYRNLMITMVLGGLWHGAGWAFLFWGLYQGGLLVAHRFFLQDKIAIESRFARGCLTIGFFHLVCVGWLLFRCGSLPPEVNAVWFILDSVKTLVSPELVGLEVGVFRTVLVMGVAVFLLQLRYESFERFHSWTDTQKVAWLVFVLLCVALFGVFEGAEFIYFQF